MHVFRMGFFAGLLLIAASTAFGGSYDDVTIPGRWLKPLVPEQGEEAKIPDYDQNSALDKARDQYWAGQYRRALVTLQSVKKGKAREIALLRGECQLELGRYQEALTTLANPAVADVPAIETL